MPRCSFCGNDLIKGTGKMYVSREGNINYFCSSKCDKNMLKLGRSGKEQKWTARHKKGKK